MHGYADLSWVSVAHANVHAQRKTEPHGHKPDHHHHTHDMHKTLTSFILIFLKVACHARWNELKLDYRPTTRTRSETFPGA